MDWWIDDDCVIDLNWIFFLFEINRIVACIFFAYNQNEMMMMSKLNQNPIEKKLMRSKKRFSYLVNYRIISITISIVCESSSSFCRISIVNFIK